MDVVEQRQMALGKKYNGIVWQHFKDFFGIPKIVLTVAMTLLLFSIIKVSAYKEWIIIGFYLILIGFTFYEMFRNRKIRKEKEILSEKNGFLKRLLINMELLREH